MPRSPYLTDEEFAMLNELYQAESTQTNFTLPLSINSNTLPLLEQASRLELTLSIDDLTLSFPVALSHPLASEEQAKLNTPRIMRNGEHPRAWRLASPQQIQLLQPNGQSLAAEVRDLSANGMRILSRRSLFPKLGLKVKPVSRHIILMLGHQQQLPLQLTLIRERKTAAFWVSAVHFSLNLPEQRLLSDFVFHGFLAQIEKQAP